MKNPLRTLAILALLLAFFSICTACAATKRAYYKDQYIDSQVESYTYTTDYQRVWQEARQILFHRGYRVIPSADPSTIETDWAAVSDSTYRRYLVTGYNYGDGRSTVHFDYYQETRNAGYSPHTTSGRDYEMEYELIKAVEYNQWSKIETSAEQYANDRRAAEESK